MTSQILTPVINKLQQNDLINKVFVTVFVDDFVLAANNEEELFNAVMIALQQMRLKNLSIKPEKVQFGEVVTLLGNKITTEGRTITDPHFSTLTALRIDETTKQSEYNHIFCLVSYFRQFLPKFASAVKHIKAAKNGQPFLLEECQKELNNL